MVKPLCFWWFLELPHFICRFIASKRIFFEENMEVTSGSSRNHQKLHGKTTEFLVIPRATPTSLLGFPQKWYHSTQGTPCLYPGNSCWLLGATSILAQPQLCVIAWPSAGTNLTDKWEDFTQPLPPRSHPCWPLKSVLTHCWGLASSWPATEQEEMVAAPVLSSKSKATVQVGKSARRRWYSPPLLQWLGERWAPITFLLSIDCVTAAPTAKSYMYWVFMYLTHSQLLPATVPWPG